MKRTDTDAVLYPGCPIRNILSRFCDKWSLLVFFVLSKNGTMRFKQLQRSIPDISQKMLTSRSGTLEEDGFVVRTVYPEVPPRVEYTLTPRAESLLPHIEGLIGWAAEHAQAILHDRKTAQTHA